ncbi:MAG: HNH endonuclease family protein [Acidobacteriota bacterium]|nr:HNH endonuclease family protein [Acidobacteriota bacterium]
METKTKEKVTGRESNLEHIYPQNPDDDAWGGEENQAAMEPYTWHIGNLTMLGERLNSKAKNSEYAVKREKYQASELKMPQEIAEQYDKWDVASIEARAKSLTTHVLKVWDFQNPSGV